MLRGISPFPTMFSKGLFPWASKGVIVGEWVNTQSQLFTTLKKKLYGNIVGKEDHFPTMFSTLSKKKKKITLTVTFTLSSANSFNLDKSKNLLVWLLGLQQNLGIDRVNLKMYLYSIHAIIFSDKSRTVDLIFRDLH